MARALHALVQSLDKVHGVFDSYQT